MTLVSIITPSYNQAKYLEQTIQSVLSQDYPRIEYIVVDGKSKDGSVDIIKRYADKLAYWISEKDKGQADAINKGFARATGEIIAWLNSDDYYLPGAVSAAVKVFEENPEIVLVYGNMLAVDEHGQTFNTLTYNQLTLRDLLCFQIIGQPAVFMRCLRNSKLDSLKNAPISPGSLKSTKVVNVLQWATGLAARSAGAALNQASSIASAVPPRQ